MAEDSNKQSENQRVKQVPPEGSLGLLAFGYKGLLAWRKARAEAGKHGQNPHPGQGNKS